MVIYNVLYILRKEDVRKGIGEIMGGKVLELESEKLKAEGKAIGRAEGEAIGQARGEQLYKEYNL